MIPAFISFYLTSMHPKKLAVDYAKILMTEFIATNLQPDNLAKCGFAILIAFNPINIEIAEEPTYPLRISSVVYLLDAFLLP